MVFAVDFANTANYHVHTRQLSPAVTAALFGHTNLLGSPVVNWLSTMDNCMKRRHFVQTGAAVLVLPWLESLAQAADGAPPKRMVCINTEFGLYGPAFFPKQAGKEYQPSEYLQLLGDLRKEMTVFSGISHPDIGGDHASANSFLTSAKHPRRPGFRNTVSIDYLAAKHVGVATRFPLLTLNTDGGGGAMTRTPSGAPVMPQHSPSKLYAAMFLAGNPKQVEQEIARLKQGQSILDHMAERLAALEGKLSRSDRRQLADYTEAVREMEQQLHANEEWASRPKPQVDAPKPVDNSNKADIIGRAELLLGIIRLALQTDTTRVCTLFMRGMDLTPPDLPVSENHHGLSHHGRNPDKIRELKIIESAQMKMFGKFLTSLRETPGGGGGSLLERTQVLIGSNLGDASGHGTTNLPILLAGGGWKHGQHIAGDVDDNTPLCNLFVSMMRQFGMEVEKFGSSTGTMTDLA